jgi:hypothetical protein
MAIVAAYCLPPAQAKDKAKKDLDKARKVLEPLAKKRADDPDFLAKLVAEVEALTQQLAKMDTA